MKKFFSPFFSCVMLACAVSVFSLTTRAASAPQPPVAKRIPRVTELHGEKLVDNYFWLRERSNSAVVAYLKAENAYTDAMMKPAEKLEKSLYKEMVKRIKETDSSVPYRKGKFLYYTRTEKGKQYAIHCRKTDEPKAKEQIVLDGNAEARGHKYFAIGASSVSDDARYFAFAVDVTGFRQYTLRVKDLTTGKMLPDKIEKVGSLEWAADNRTLLYTVEDEAKRQYRLFRHTLGGAHDVLVYEEKDEMFDIGVGRTRSGAYLFCASSSKTTSEVRWLASAQPAGEWKVVLAREAGHEYDVDHHGDRFYIRTNKGGRNFRLVSAPVENPAADQWREEIPHRAGVMLSSVDFFAEHCVLHEREGGLPQLRVMNLATRDVQRLEFPEPAYDLSGDSNEEWNATKFRYSYQSFITPRSVFEFDMQTGKTTLLKRTEVPGGYDPAKFVVERVNATAADGTQIPISLAHKRGVPHDGSAPLLLDGYGAYGLPNDVGFSVGALSLLDRGVIFAMAHIRGGGELGKPWHDAGRMEKKKNSFNDFIAAAEFLVEKKYTSRERLVIQGGSAGGLLMGAVLNLRPDLFKAAVLDVPFVDVINTMLDETLPLTVTEFEEWGNPKQKAEFDYIRSYCPYTNLAARDYPAMLVKTSFHDSQVMYWEPAKYVAKLRSLKTDKNPLLLKVNMNAGHGGASGRYDSLRELAFSFSFVLTQVGIKK
jgi:oligopeptidase B